MRLLGVIVATTAVGWFGAAGSAPRGPDLELGRYLATECMTCHRNIAQASAAGTAAAAIPDIYGMAEQSFVQVVKAYRAKELPNAVMQNIAARLQDEEIEALAAFFAQAKP